MASPNSGISGPAAIYLDWNATSPIHPQVLARMHQCAEEVWGNPSSVHRFGRAARELGEQARATIARNFGAHPRDLLFVSGGTEANNLGLLDAPGLVTSELEHPSITRCAKELERRQRPVRWLKVCTNGQVDLESLQQALQEVPRGAVVALQAVNHETGVIQPLAAAESIARRAGAWLHVDAVQALGKLDPSAYLFGDSFSIAAHKIRGPKGVGALIWRCGRPAPRPLLFGGQQQRGLRPGTPDPMSAAGFAVALDLAKSMLSSRAGIELLRNRLEANLARIGESNVLGSPRLGHVVSWYVPTWRSDELVAALDVEGVGVSGGSACSAGTAEPSAVISAMLGVERASRTIRLSLGDLTTPAEIELATTIIHRVVARAAQTQRTPGLASSDG